MIDENERAAQFLQAIQRDAEHRRSEIVKAIDAETAAELEKKRTEAEKKAARMEEYETQRATENANRLLSQSVLDAGAELARRRGQIADEVFAACEKEITNFVSSPDYGPFLKENAAGLLKLLRCDAAQFFARPQDLELARQNLPAGCTVEADATIRLGGLRARAGITEADDTLDIRMENQKDWFLRSCGMSIALEQL